jgi:ferredoxin
VTVSVTPDTESSLDHAPVTRADVDGDSCPARGPRQRELHFEQFAAAPVIDGEEFSVSVASTGTTVRVGAEETLLSALQRADIWPPCSCRQGFCGTCRTRVLDGRVDHRDTLLTDPERTDGMMLVCISRATKGQRLILDL